jgi:hypothetical protein
MPVSGTFASLGKQGLIIDKSRLWNPDPPSPIEFVQKLDQGSGEGAKAAKINFRNKYNGR